MKKPLFFAIVTPVFWVEDEPTPARPDIIAVTAIIDARGLYEVFDLETGEHATAHERYIFSERAAILNPPEFAEMLPDYWKRFLERYPKFAVEPILKIPEYWKRFLERSEHARQTPAEK